MYGMYSGSHLEAMATKHNWARPQQPSATQVENWQNEIPKRKRNRNRNRKRSQNRQRTQSTTSTNDGRHDQHSNYRTRYDSGPQHFNYRQRTDSNGQAFHYQQRTESGQRGNFRPRTESNISVGGLSVVSALTNESKSNRGSDHTQGQRGPRNLRWDRDRLSREIWSFYLDNSQSSDLLTRKHRLKDALHKILTTTFPNYEVELFIVGSTANGLANNTSDVDICLVMNEIDTKSTTTTVTAVKDEDIKDSKESSILDKVMANVSEQREPKEKTEVAIIVNYEDTEPSIDKSNVSSESVGTTSSTATNGLNGMNGTNDPTIPLLEMVKEVLKAYNFVTKLQIIMAKVPILKFVDRISGIEVTLNVNKLVSIRNTHLIHDYTKLDWRLQPLVMVIKAWAKDHGINDAYNKSISSYSLVLMVIHYLQFACDPPVLPCLQQLDPEKYKPDLGIKSIRMERKPRRWKSHNQSSLKELLVGFLDYYSYSFCYSKDAISIRLGHILPKHVVQRYKSNENQFSHWKYMCIEEPFNRTNTARSVYDEVTFERILSVFRVSHYTLRRYPILDSIMTGNQYSKDYATVIDQYVNAK